MKAQTAGTGGLGGGMGPLTHAPPPRYGTTCEGAPPPAGGSAEATSAGRNRLPRNLLTTDP